MTHQLSDRELINRLSQTAYDTGREYEAWINSKEPTLSGNARERIGVRSKLENDAVERLIVRDEKIKQLQAELAALKRELAVLA